MVSHLPLPTTPNPFQSPRRTVLHCQLEVWYPDFSVCNAVKASFSHFSLAGSVNSPFQEFGVDFPLHIYDIQCLRFPCPTGFPFPFLISFKPELSKILPWSVSMGDCCWQLGREEQKEKGKKRNNEEASRRKDSWGKRELSEQFWKQLTASCCLQSAFVFKVLNSVTTLFIQFSGPDSALKLPDTVLNILPAKASIMEMKPCYKKTQLTLKRDEFKLWDGKTLTYKYSEPTSTVPARVLGSFSVCNRGCGGRTSKPG